MVYAHEADLRTDVVAEFVKVDFVHGVIIHTIFFFCYLLEHSGTFL